jgi:YVTN family beta-propeller protein
MKSLLLAASLLALGGAMPTLAGQAPYGAAAPDIPLSSHDRIYTSDQFSNTVSVVDPSTNKTLGVIRLGDSSPQNRLYRLELSHVHRHRDEQDQTCHLCWPRPARGFLDAGRQGSVGDRARRGLRRCSGRLHL